MRYINLFKFDLVHGILKQYYKYMIFSLFITFAMIEFKLTLTAVGIQGETYADYLLYIYGGEKEYIPIPGEIFKLPYLWILNHILILYFTLNYMYKDLIGVGQQIISRTGSRRAWWLSKCFCQIISVLAYYAVAWIGVFVFFIYTGRKLSWKNSDFMIKIMDFGPKMIEVKHLNVLLEITVFPIMFTVCLSLLQMTLCLYLKPIFSYIISVIICIASAYTTNFLLIGNYAMALRSDKVVFNGVNGMNGVIAFILIIAFSAVAGDISFRRYNILDRSE